MLILIGIFVLYPIRPNASHIQVYIRNVYDCLVSCAQFTILALVAVLFVIRNLKVVRLFTGQGMKMKIKLGKDSARKDNGVSTLPSQ